MQVCWNIFKYILMGAIAQALVEAGTMTKWWIASLSGLRFCPVAAVFGPIPLFWPCWAQTGAGSGLFWRKWWIALVVPTSSSTTSSRVPLRLKRLNCLQPPWSLGALLKRQVRLTSELSMDNVLPWMVWRLSFGYCPSAQMVYFLSNKWRPKVVNEDFGEGPADMGWVSQRRNFKCWIAFVEPPCPVSIHWLSVFIAPTGHGKYLSPLLLLLFNTTHTLVWEIMARRINITIIAKIIKQL